MQTSLNTRSVFFFSPCLHILLFYDLIMKLLSIANRLYLAAVIFVFSAGSLAAYFILKSIINKEFNEKLLAEKEQLIYELHTYDHLQETYYLNIGDIIEVRDLNPGVQLAATLKDTVMYDPYEKKELPFRILTFSDQFNGRNYMIRIKKSLLPNQDLIEGISEIMIGLVLALALSLGLLNRFIFKKLWAPFHGIIRQLQHFNITEPRRIAVEINEVEEFQRLKEVLDKMIDKSIRDYKNLKEYTENTTHEIQTPLAIIKSKAEMLLQEPLTEPVLKDVSQIYEAATRLARLKEGLSRLSKIENNQFVYAEAIHLADFIRQKLEALSEAMEVKNLSVSTTFHAEPVLQMNNDLAFMLITNLIGNAIKHNIEGGRIIIVTDDSSFTIENTGREPSVPTGQLFDRFKRSPHSRSDGSGLGLSVVKGIVDFYNMPIQYTYDSGWHRIRIDFLQ